MTLSRPFPLVRSALGSDLEDGLRSSEVKMMGALNLQAKQHSGKQAAEQEWLRVHRSGKDLCLLSAVYCRFSSNLYLPQGLFE